jgi:hypothetical protein
VYVVEIAIIFIGITISFLFDQWREENRQKEELIVLAESLLRDAEIGKAHLATDLAGTNRWISNLDSLRMQRDSQTIKESQLIWFYNMLTGKTFGLFDSKSPAYLSAISNGLLTKLPDSIQLEIYDIYEAKLPDFQYLYDQQLETIKYFRNEQMIHSNEYLYHTNASMVRIDLKKFAQEVQLPIYGNFINQIITAEVVVRDKNIKLREDFDSIIKTLRAYIEVLKTQ